MNEPVKEIRATQITMGRGLVDVTRIEHEGRAGILFRPRQSHIPVGEPGELSPGEYWPVEGDVVIWIENEAGASVIQKYLSPFLSWEDEEKLTVEEAWTILCETPDITSPVEYPDHALVTIEQLGSIMARATPIKASGTGGEA